MFTVNGWRTMWICNITSAHYLQSITFFSIINCIFKIIAFDALPPSSQSRLITKQERLAVECLKPKYQGPCKMFQRRKCVRRKNTERGLWKMVRCRGNAANSFLLMKSQYPPISEQDDILFSTGRFVIISINLKHTGWFYFHFFIPSPSLNGNNPELNITGM